MTARSPLSPVSDKPGLAATTGRPASASISGKPPAMQMPTLEAQQIRLEDLRKLEHRIEDKRKAIRMAEQKTQQRSEEMLKREQFITVHSGRATALKRKAEELENREKKLAERENAHHDLDSKTKLVEQDEKKQQVDEERLMRQVQHFELSREHFNDSKKQLLRELETRRGFALEWSAANEKLREELKRVDADVELKRMDLMRKRPSERTQQLEALEQRLKQMHFDITNERKALDADADDLRFKERDLQNRERTLREQQTVVQKLRMHLKWADEENDAVRESLKAAQEQTVQELLRLEKAGMRSADDAALVARREYEIEEEKLRGRRLSIDIDRRRKVLRQMEAKLRDVAAKHAERAVRQRQVAEKMDSRLQEQEHREVVLAERLRRLEAWGQHVAERAAEQDSERRELTAAEDAVREWLEELRWREHEIATAGAKRNTADMRNAGGDQSLLASAVDSSGATAADLCSSLARVRLSRARASYLQFLHHRRCAAPKQGWRGGPPRGGAAEVAYLSGAFSRAVGRLRGLDPAWKGGGRRGPLSVAEVESVRSTLDRERMLRPRAALLATIARCPILHPSRKGSRENILEMQDWLNGALRDAEDAEAHSLLQRKEILTLGIVAADRILSSTAPPSLPRLASTCQESALARPEAPPSSASASDYSDVAGEVEPAVSVPLVTAAAAVVPAPVPDPLQRPATSAAPTRCGSAGLVRGRAALRRPKSTPGRCAWPNPHPRVRSPRGAAGGSGPRFLCAHYLNVDAGGRKAVVCA